MIDQQNTIAFLASGAALPGAGTPVRHDTHAAIVFLVGDRAWKLKRAVRFDYLDFSTSERRRAVLERELELNRRTAPDLYLAVHPINLASDGSLKIDGAGEPVDWLLEMRRLPDEVMLDRIVAEGGLDDRVTKGLADRLVIFHASLKPASPFDPVEAIRHVVTGNRNCMAIYPELLDPALVAAIASRSESLLQDLSALVRSRALAGRVRHGHGDLHLGNIAVIDGIPIPFDCLEFDDAMATTDVLYDLAFLLMDLWRRGAHRQANLIFNRYLDLSAADEDGVALLPLFLSMRASVRAHVEAAVPTDVDNGSEKRARDYLAAAAAFLEPSAPTIVAIGGLSGTGKSTLARNLACHVGRPPGARVISSDVLRKRAHGVGPEQRLPKSAYGPDNGDAVYGRMVTLAAAALRQGQSAIIDATFATAHDRQRVPDLASGSGWICDAVWLRAEADRRLKRVHERRDDASDINQTTAAHQIEPDDAMLADWHILSADQDCDAMLKAARDCLPGGRKLSAETG